MQHSTAQHNDRKEKLKHNNGTEPHTTVMSCYYSDYSNSGTSLWVNCDPSIAVEALSKNVFASTAGVVHRHLVWSHEESRKQHKLHLLLCTTLDTVTALGSLG